MSLDTYLEHLRMAAEELETKDELRTAECRNIATVVDIVRQRVKLGMFTKDFLERYGIGSRGYAEERKTTQNLIFKIISNDDKT